MKHEWRKKEKKVYLPENVPTIIELSPMKYFTIEGEGNPGDSEFSDAVGALYALSYAIKMSYKSEKAIDGYFEYTVYPLEGFWDLNQKGKDLYAKGTPITELKECLKYKLMIRQPDFVNVQVFDSYKAIAYQKKKDNRILDVSFETIDEGLVCQMLHIGSYDEEPKSFENMEKYCLDVGFKRKSKGHKEIYLSDPKKVTPEKLKTTLRFSVRPIK